MLNQQHTQKTRDRIHGHKPCQQALLPCYCVIYGCGYESSTQTKFTYYKLESVYASNHKLHTLRNTIILPEKENLINCFT